MNTITAPTQPAETPSVAQAELRRMGREAYVAGRSYGDCQTTWEREGYRLEMNRAADGQTSAYLASLNGGK